MIMPLLTEIISEATAKNGDLSRMLRLCLVLAATLKHDALLGWVRHELEGYPAAQPLPDYRVLRASNKGQFVGPGFQCTLNIPISVLPDKLQPLYENFDLRDGIADYIHLLASTTGNKGGLQIPWPGALAAKYASAVVTRGRCIEAWMEFPPRELAAMLDKIKTRVLAFALAMAGENPNAGEIDARAAPVDLARMSQILATTILGAQGGGAADGSPLLHGAIGAIEVDGVDSLLDALRAAGLGESDLDNFQAALLKDRNTGAEGLGEAVKAWLGELLLKAGQGAAAIAAEVVVGAVLSALGRFFGERKRQ